MSFIRKKPWFDFLTLWKDYCLCPLCLKLDGESFWRAAKGKWFVFTCRIWMELRRGWEKEREGNYIVLPLCDNGLLWHSHTLWCGVSISQYSLTRGMNGKFWTDAIKELSGSDTTGDSFIYCMSLLCQTIRMNIRGKSLH